MTYKYFSIYFSLWCDTELGPVLSKMYAIQYQVSLWCYTELGPVLSKMDEAGSNSVSDQSEK